MRFVQRVFTGGVIALVSVGLVGAAGWRLYSAVSGAEKRQRPPAREKTYKVDVERLKPRAVSPIVTAYGQVQAWKSLEIRAPATGPVTEISDNFRDGLMVKAGELLFRIDPEMAERRVIDGRAALKQAEAELAEATTSITHVQAEIEAARSQATVRRKDLERKETLFAKSLVSATALGELRLAVSVAEQAIVVRQQALVAMKARAERARSGVERAKLALNDAERVLKDTSYRAPYDGRLSEVALTLGRRVSQNEKLAVLLDPAALEVSFPVRNSEFGRLLDPKSPDRLLPRPVKVTLDLATTAIRVGGVLNRTAAVASPQSGRTLYARLKDVGTSVLRPGDFVKVEIEETELSGVAIIPAEAATVDGRVLLVGEDGRLVEHAARVLRRQGDTVIVDRVPFGKVMVKRRLPFLANGVKVVPREAGREPVAGHDGSGKSWRRGTKDAGSSSGGDVVVLDKARRAKLIARVKSARGLPERRRARMLEELSKAQPSRRMIERIERMMARVEKRS
jgi:biotin carboxyl carrier protein